MPLERLEKHILEGAKSRADEIKGEARKQAERILAEARAKAKEIEAAAERSAREEIARREAEQDEGMDLQERAALLEARNKAMEATISRLRRLVVKKAGKKGLKRLINSAIDEAGRIAPQEGLTLVIGKKNSGLVNAFGGRIRYGAVGNGVELHNKSGSVRINATMEGLFEENRQEIETMLLEEAFPKRGRSARRTRK